MKTNLSLNSSEWCDFVFEGKNKEYGAYAMRQSSWKFHLIAFACTILFTALVIVSPSIAKAFGATEVKIAERGPGYTDAHELDDLEKKVEIEVIIPEVEQPKLEKLAATIQFTPPEIIDDNLLDKSKEMKTIDDIKDSKLIIHTTDNFAGSLDVEAKLPVDFTEIMEKPIEVKEPFVSVQEMPQFAGGESAMNRFIRKNLKYPARAQERSIQGRVTVRFVVSSSGMVENAEVLRGIDPSCDAEALRVVKMMPKWISGKQNGTAVPVYFTLPILFRLQ